MTIISEKSAAAFSEVVDEACEHLMDCQIKYSVRRIQEMTERLDCIEQELDEFLVRSPTFSGESK